MQESVNKFEISNYTYDAAGERVVRYVPGRLEAFYSAHNAGGDDRLESFVYPSGLLTVKTLPLKPGTDLAPRMKLTTYTKHYYLGSERIASSLGRANDLGLFCKELQTYGMDNYLNEMDSKTAQAGEELNADYQYFEKALNLSSPILYNNAVPGCSLYPDSEKEYAVFWFHPDHLGSSSYISNLSGEISQHFEYFPFGETLVEEHKNSNNSPYKFNAKELDNETGNYYYGARYYSPKYNLMLSVDPASEMYPSFSPYAYTLQNPVKYIDPTGMVVEDPPTYYDKLDEVSIIASKEGVNLTNSGYTEDDYRVRNDVLEAGGPSATALLSAEKKGRFNPIYDSSGHWDGFSEEFSSGWNNIDKDGTANFWMNATAIGVVGSILTTSPLSAGVFSRGSLQAGLLKSSISASIQLAINQQFNITGALADGFMLPGFGDFLGSGFDMGYDLKKGFYKNTVLGNKTLHQTGKEAIINTMFNVKISGLDALTPSVSPLGRSLYYTPNTFANYSFQKKHIK